MGRNFVSVCHVHKVRRWYYRGEEARPMHDFYSEHDNCMRVNETNVGTFDDQMQEHLIPEEYTEQPDIEEELKKNRPYKVAPK